MNKLEQFSEKYGEYIYNDIFEIAMETTMNYLPLRNHTISVNMLEDNNMYNTFSESEKFNWKNNFLNEEQLQNHIKIMSLQFRDKAWDWLGNNKILEEELISEYSDNEASELYDMFILNIWKEFVN